MTKKPKIRYGLTRRHTKKAARDFVDFDYLGELTAEELDWLDKFSREFYHARFLNDTANIHQKPTDCYSADNARRRDIWNNFDRVPMEFTSYDPEDDDK